MRHHLHSDLTGQDAELERRQKRLAVVRLFAQSPAACWEHGHDLKRWLLSVHLRELLLIAPTDGHCRENTNSLTHTNTQTHTHRLAHTHTHTHCTEEHHPHSSFCKQTGQTAHRRCPCCTSNHCNVESGTHASPLQRTKWRTRGILPATSISLWAGAGNKKDCKNIVLVAWQEPTDTLGCCFLGFQWPF